MPIFLAIATFYFFKSIKIRINLVIMSKLSKDWLTEDHIDLELKQYVLLAYLQEVKENYQATKIYPYLGELIEHYKNLLLIKKHQDELLDQTPKELKGFNFKDGKIEYKKPELDNEIIETINNIIDFAMPLMAKNIQDGKTIYDLVEEHFSFKSVGISPLNNDEGYLLLHCANEKDVYAYQYQLTLFTTAQKSFRGLYVNEVEHYVSTFTSSYENIKSDLIQKNKELPNPAVYVVDCSLSVPLHETFLPIAKRYFVNKIST